MKQLSIIFLTLMAVIVSWQCGKTSDDDLGPTGTSGGLSTNKSSMTVLLDAVSTAVISGGEEPYSISAVSDPGVVTAYIDNRQLVVDAQAVGTTTVTVKDASSTPKTAAIVITVTKELTAAGPGTLSFSSNKGDFSAAGVGKYGVEPPSSGEGALALQDFESIILLAYNVRSATDVDLVVIELKSNTSDYSGSFAYPASGKVVQLSYYPATDPTDSLFFENGYGLTSTGSASVSTVSAAAIEGTFFGKGYFWTNGQAVLSDSITVTNGTFHLPIIHFSAIEEATIDRRVKQAMVHLYRWNRSFE